MSAATVYAAIGGRLPNVLHLAKDVVIRDVVSGTVEVEQSDRWTHPLPADRHCRPSPPRCRSRRLGTTGSLCGAGGSPVTHGAPSLKSWISRSPQLIVSGGVVDSI